MSRLETGVAWLVQRWTSAYTAGLGKEGGDQRRAEIESDLWEHFEAARADGENLASTGVQVLLRMVAGVPADVRWRIHVGAMSRRQFVVAGGGTLEGWREHRRPRWIDRHFWVVPLGLLLAVCVVMVWSSFSSRPSRLSFALEAPEHLIISHERWELRPPYSSHIETYRWHVLQTHFFTVSNSSAREITVRIEGLEKLPDGFGYSFAQLRPGYVQMIAEAEALVLAFGRGDDTQADFEAFKVRYGIPSVVTSPIQLSGSRIWSLSDELRVTCLVESPDAACSPTITVPPNGVADVGMRIVPKEGTETGTHRDIRLRIVEVGR